MGLYTVAAACVVGDLHYAQVPAGPIEVDDMVAAALVKSGALLPHGGAAPQDGPAESAEHAPVRRRTAKD